MLHQLEADGAKLRGPRPRITSLTTQGAHLASLDKKPVSGYHFGTRRHWAETLLLSGPPEASDRAGAVRQTLGLPLVRLHSSGGTSLGHRVRVVGIPLPRQGAVWVDVDVLVLDDLARRERQGALPQRVAGRVLGGVQRHGVVRVPVAQGVGVADDLDGLAVDCRHELLERHGDGRGRLASAGGRRRRRRDTGLWGLGRREGRGRGTRV
ncbi:hypothetical protein TCAP_01576 [Tolypocladium capitatum]|uniref:Uncharacterized protein n=1 Tax=Tolypocladium capitatum TaxID=45235 RepID=A0A2K3QLS0_9HYPO|nr:hypothetical protein TCAP_01576 [Tolypocladium capitatum]